MSLTANLSPAAMALAGNPIKLSISSTSPVSYEIRMGNDLLFSGSGVKGSFFVFIDETLSSSLFPVRSFNESVDLLIPVDIVKEYNILLKNAENETFPLSGKVIYGGISKRSLRRLNDENSNIFTYKLLNNAGNLFMTTRTTKRIIELRETELMPLQFLWPTGIMIIKTLSGLERRIEGVTGKGYSLNLSAIRNSFFLDNNQLINYFDIFFDNVYSCGIAIVPGMISRSRYVIEFLNSYGAYERIEVTGVANLTTEKEQDETYVSYDELVNDYVESKERLQSKDTLKVETGYKNSDELLFLLDMLSSNNVSLLGYDGRSIKVNVDAENLSLAAKMVEPQSLLLNLKFADKESYYTQAIQDDDFGSPRIHTEPFSEQFN